MKISELKQPHRRMAEYLRKLDCREDYSTLETSFQWFKTDRNFWFKVYDGKYPPITEEIKSHFPDDFDFSGEEVNNKFKPTDEPFSTHDALILDPNNLISEVKKEINISINEEQLLHRAKPLEKKILSLHDLVESNNRNMSLFDKENQRKIEDENLQKQIYTKLAKEGKFDELPDTCEFSEPVELNVWDVVNYDKLHNVVGKFRGRFISKHFDELLIWAYAQLPKPKIDFSEFKEHDLIEVETLDNNYIGYFVEERKDVIDLSYTKGNRLQLYILSKEEIKSINKIK